MIKQAIANNSILEKKFKILRTSIMLGNIDNRSEAISTYEEAAREVDNLRRGVYEELLAGKIYSTNTLEDEQARLKDLIQFIENRVKERNEFIDDYIKITSNFLDDLPKVSLEDELADYKLRLDNITEYLDNCAEIESLNLKLKAARDELEEKYDNKASNEIINSKLEDELIDEFNKIVMSDEYYASLNYADLDGEILKSEKNMHEKEDVMNTFISSYEALKKAGISGSEREEYLSYVQDAKNDYYNEIEKNCLLRIYKLVLNKETTYDMLFSKREELDKIIKERIKYREDLNITSRDLLTQFINICNEQFSVIKSQKYNNEDIDKLILEIADCESRLEELEAANSREAIVALLDEFAVKSPEALKIDMPEEKDMHDEEDIFLDDGDEVVSKEVPRNMVVRVKEPSKIDVKKATDTAKVVMKRVVIVLEPKKFNKRKDKLEKIEKEILAEDAVTEDVGVAASDGSIVPEVALIPAGNDNLTIKLDVGGSGESKPIEVKESEEEEPKEEHEPEDDTIIKEIPIAEEPEEEVPEEEPTDFEKDKPLDLFSQTDPFLDDNQFEIDASMDREDETAKGMPTIDNIGTVRPNNLLNKYEDNEVEDIILPSMGITDNSSKIDVPIVSENYIN